MTITEFLLARITEDEAVARRAQRAYQHVFGIPHYFTANHVTSVAMSPPTALAECEAKRRIVELHDHGDRECWEMKRGVYGPGWPEGSYAVEGELWAHPSLESPEIHPGACETKRLLALPYADHPDYDPAWHKIALPAVVLYRPDTEPPAALSIPWPPDEAAVERVARALHNLGHPDGCHCGALGWEAWASDARAVLDALGADR